jgi:MFS family permease
VIAVLSLCGTLAALQQTLSIPLLSELPEIFAIDPDDASWSITVTLLTAAVATPIVSRAADMYGKRRMLGFSMSAMCIGSLVAALGDSFTLLLVGRGLQGFATSLIPVGISIMRDELPPNKVSSGVALMSGTLGIGTACGPPLSGVLFGHFGWESLFWFSAGLSVMLLVTVYAVIPESSVRTSGRFDYLGAVIVSVALTALLLAVSKGGTWGWSSPRVLGSFFVALVAFATWFPYELRVSEPMVDLRTSGRRAVLLTNIASMLVTFAMFVSVLLTSFQLQLPELSGYGFGLSITLAGLAMVPGGLVMALVAPLSATMLNRWGGKPLLVAGAALMSMICAGRIAFSNSVGQIIAGSTLVGLGTALALAAMPTLIMAAVPITETASANGLNMLLRAMGMSISSAVVAGALASITLSVEGQVLPARGALSVLFAIAAGGTFLAAGLAVGIPSSTPLAVPAEQLAEHGREAVTSKRQIRERVIRGKILPGGVSPDGVPGIVMVFTADGAQIDWSRTDHDGNYTVVLPGLGRYLITGTARGWKPRAEIFDYRGDDAPHHVVLTEETNLSGRISDAGEPSVAALVILSGAEGEFVLSTRTDGDGRFHMPLPPMGPYILTAMNADQQRAGARKVVVTPRPLTADLDLGRNPRSGTVARP